MGKRGIFCPFVSEFLFVFVSPVWKCSHAWIFRDFYYVRVQDVFNRSMRKLPFAISYRSDDKIPGLLMVMWLAGGENGGKAKNFRVQARSPGLVYAHPHLHMLIFNCEKFSTWIWRLRFPVYVKLNRSVDIEIRWTKKEKNYTLQF